MSHSSTYHKINNTLRLPTFSPRKGHAYVFFCFFNCYFSINTVVYNITKDEIKTFLIFFLGEATHFRTFLYCMRSRPNLMKQVLVSSRRTRHTPFSFGVELFKSLKIYMQTNIEPSHSVCYLKASLQLEVFDSFFLRIHTLNSQTGPSTAGSSRAISQSSVMNSVVSLP